MIGVDWKSLQKQTNGAIETEPKGTINKQPGKSGKKNKKITKMNIKKQPNGALYGPCLDHVARLWHKDNYLI